MTLRCNHPFLTNTGTMKQADEERFSALLAWAHTHGASLHEGLEVYQDDVTGFSMRVKPTQVGGLLDPQDGILTCPLRVSLSYLNALQDGPLLGPHDHDHHHHHAAFPPEFMAALPPHIISRFFLMKQYLLGKSSFWHPYIATLPQPDAAVAAASASWNLPPFWPQQDIAFLDGTNTGVALHEIHDAVKAEYKQARRLLKSTGFTHYQDYTSSLHTWAFSMFASRSFRPSLVLPTRSVWDKASPHVPAGVQLDDFSVLLPVFDIINHSMHVQVRWLVDDDAAACRFQTLDTYPQPCQQIFNSYGTKTNSELLLSYGFILPETDALHNDYIHLRKKTAASPTTTPAGENWTSSNNPPQDFLVSLRPMNHPSSLAGSRRQLVAKQPDFDIRPEFAHVQDGLIWDLCLMVVGEGNKASFMHMILSGITESIQDEIHTSSNTSPDGQELECLRRILSTSSSQTLPPEVTQVLIQVQQILLAKLGQEYDKICETDPGAGVDEDGNEILVEVLPQTNNQKLALAYRGQAKKVLEHAIAALVPDWQTGGDESKG